MAYVHENDVSEYFGLFRHIVGSFNLYWLLAPLAVLVFFFIRLVSTRHSLGSWRVPMWCARWIKWGRFNPHAEYASAICDTNLDEGKALKTFHWMARRQYPPGTVYEIRKVKEWERGEDFGEFRYVGHRYPAYPEGAYTSKERAEVLPQVGGEVIWSGTT